MADILTDSLTVKIGEDEFIFKIPTPRQQNQIKTRALALRRADDPTGPGWEEGLDWITINSYRGMALMETLLTKSSTSWAFTPGESGTMVVDSSKFPNHLSTEFFAEVWAGFNTALDDFREQRARPGLPPGSQAVAG